jgi:hypothetical protein
VLNRAALAAMAALLLTASACSEPERRSAEEPAPAAEVAGEAAMGAITGRLSYPSDLLPGDLQVCAEDVASSEVSCDSQSEDGTYRLALPPGRYTVWAQTGEWPGVRAFYSRAVPCGLSVECEDHTPIVVEVTANATVTGIDPGDWYAES